MYKSKTLFSSVLLTGCLLLLSNSVRAWERTLSHCDICGGRADAVVVDAAGDVIAGGVTNGSEVVKMSKADGSVIWRYAVFPGSGPPVPRVYRLAVDSNGDVFVIPAFTTAVIKLSGATGTEIWRGSVGVTTHNNSYPFIEAVEIDRDNNVVTAGRIAGMFNVGKLRGTNGTEMWRYERAGSAYDVAIDTNGNVAAVGQMNQNFATVRLNGIDGSEIWQREINGTGVHSDIGDFEVAHAVTTDSGGNVLAVGVTNNLNANGDFTVAKYSLDGTRIWMRIIDGTSHSNDVANAVVIDRDDNVIAAGSITDANPFGSVEHFHVIKFSGTTGNNLWSKPAQDVSFNGGEIQGRAFALSVNAYGNIVAAGQHNYRFTAVKFWGSNGGRPWLYSSGPPTGSSTAYDVVMDSASNVIAAGEVMASNGWQKFTVVKLRRADGTSYQGYSIPPVPEIVKKYAPLVYLHSDDDYRPGDPMSFISSSELRWSHQAQYLIFQCGDHTEVPRGEINANNLGATAQLPYSHMPKVHSESSCEHRTDITKLKANEYTRPFGGNDRHNVLGWEQDYMKEGFFLDPDNEQEARAGNPAGETTFSGAPVFYEYKEHQFIAYWFFYPYDEFKPGLIPLQYHEGDWERIIVKLNNSDELTNVSFDSHGKPKSYEASEIEFEGTHPVVYSATGSHASYRFVGNYPVFGGAFSDRTNKGPKWTSWSNLNDVKLQPWYGFGGAWGEVELGHSPVQLFSGKDFTGPLGPSRYKSSSMPTVEGQNITVAESNITINFNSVISGGYSEAVALSENQIQSLPSGYFLPSNTPMYDITTSATFSGSIKITFKVPNVAGQEICSRLGILHYINNSWDSSGNLKPVYDGANQICTVSQIVSSLSPFVVVQYTGADCTKVALPGSNLKAFVNSLVPGDVGCLRAGVHGARGTEIFMTASGTQAAPITVRGYPGDAMPTILGYFPIGGQYIVISGLLFDGPTGLVDANPPNPAVERNVIAIYGSNVEINHCEIRNSLAHAGIYLEGAYNARLIGNYIHDNGNFNDPSTANLDHGIYFGSGSGLIANNLIEHNYAFGVHLYPSTSNVVVQQNTIIKNGRSGVIIGGWTTNCPAAGCPPQPTNTLVVNNIIAFNAYYAFQSFELMTSGHIIKNNLLWENAGGNIPTDERYTRNLTFVNQNNNIADPRFAATSNYRLQSGSPAIDAALNPYTQPDDYDFIPRPQGAASDIGAFERQDVAFYSISGTVTYGTSAAKTVSGVLMSVSGSASSSINSDSSGNYLLGNLPAGGRYTVTPSKTGNINGISPFDATLVLRHVAANGQGPNALNANQQKAADTNGDGNITPFDATVILRYIAFGGPNANTGQVGTWKFDPVSNPHPALNSSVSGENYTAFLIGEVNGDWTPPNSLNEMEAAEWQQTEMESFNQTPEQKEAEISVITDLPMFR
jgi:parallel beta-helix repeat protein